MKNQLTQNIMLTSARYAPEREYWLKNLAGEWSMSGFPTDRTRRIAGSAQAHATLTTQIDGETYERLGKISNGNPLALYMELVSGVSYLLYRYTGSDDIVIGMPDSKINEESEQMTSSLYALRTIFQPEDTGRDVLLRVKEAVTAARKHRGIPYELIKEQLPVQDVEGAPLFRTLVALRDVHDMTQLGHGDFSFLFDAEPDALHVQVVYDAELYDLETVEQIVRHLNRVLDQTFGEINRPLSQIELLLEDEYQQIAVDYNDTKTDYPSDKALHQLFVEQAARIPQQVAVLADGISMTYQELHDKSNQCAHFLLERGIEVGDRVAVITKRNANTVVHMLGILKAGAAYVPIEPDAPEERKASVLQNSGCRYVLEPDAYEQENMSASSIDDPGVPYDPERLAYIIYTSGSTGTPKGVAISHRAGLNTVWEINRRFGVGEQDRVIGISSMCFDLSVYDLFGTLAAGATLVMVPSNRNIPQLLEAVETHQITVWNSVPAILGLAAETLQDGFRNHSLRLVLLSGDWIPVDLYGKVKPFFPNVQMYGLAGPTEISIWCNCHPIDQVEFPEASIPLGRPTANQRCYVLNRDLQLCPYGVEGEIYVAGDGLAIGYYNDDERTRATFLEHPRFGRVYKSGDQGMIKRDGLLRILGRKDFQIKLRGYRIETNEIQVALLQYPAVQSAVVKAVGTGSEQSLCAYLVTDGEVGVDELRSFLERRLPDYMIPSYFVRLEQLPLSPNGKVDLKALPAPVGNVTTTSVRYEAPRNEVEEKLVAIWQEVLGLERVGVHDNFFALGGDSMKALRVITLLATDYLLEIQDMFEEQTIAKLSEAMMLKSDNVKKRIEQLKEAQSVIVDEQTPELQAWMEMYESNYRSYDSTDLSQVIAYEHILLTGGTGYLGAHLLKQLLESTSARLHLIVRGRDNADAERRLLRQIEHYHGALWFEQYRDRVQVLQGDVAGERLGLSTDVYEELAERVDCIINSAGNVKHYGPYEDFYQPNVQSVERILEFAAAGRKKDINHISTVGLASGTVPGKLFTYYTEYERSVGQDLDNYYHVTKMEAEELFENARAKGQSVNIFRMGNLVFESHSGKFQSNIEDNAFYATVRSAIHLGIVPEQVRYLVDFTFIDYASKAVAQLFNRAELRDETYHIINPDYIDIPRLTGLLAPYFDLKHVSLNEYLDTLADRYSDPLYSDYVQNIFTFIGIFNPTPTLTTFRILAHKTNHLLHHIGFEWPELTEEHVQKMIEYCRDVEFL